MGMQMLLPRQAASIGPEDIQSWVADARTARPFAPEVTAACAALSQRIMRERAAREFPELLALAFWIRPAEIQRLREEFERFRRPDRLLMPRGTVFHLPPRNVDTMFVYSWLLSALTGNRNIIRLSPQRSETTNLLLRLFQEALAEADEPARSSTLVVSYGHEEETTALLSSICDTRVIWGGDFTVASIRRTPLPVHARELTFPDRHSLSALKADAYLQLSEEERDQLADRFFNDAYWFDQAGCSSPRLVAWCGEPAETEQASADFFPRVAANVRRRRYVLSPSLSMRKLVFSAARILELPVANYRRFPELTVLTLESLEGFSREHPGGGLFYECHIGELGELAPKLIRKDQTVAWFGFTPEELCHFVQSLNGAAIDRVVPIGQALQFGRFWDGMDLLQEFCRHVHLQTAVPAAAAATQHK
jgi:hypothetical protein